MFDDVRVVAVNWVSLVLYCVDSVLYGQKKVVLTFNL